MAGARHARFLESKAKYVLNLSTFHDTPSVEILATYSTVDIAAAEQYEPSLFATL